MKKLIKLSDTFKISIIYFITTIVSMLTAGFIVKYEYVKSDLRSYLWVAIIFTSLFLILIRLFKVKYKSILIFLGIIMFLLLFVPLDSDFFISLGNTPDESIFPIMSFIAIYTTLPFQSVIKVLIGYDIGEFSYIIVQIYMLILSLLSYITLKFKVKNYNIQDEQY
ncbi:hypothetical protein HMPREF1092_02070 [Clostridium thermobutyricum]|uniref:Uncharacterized protein n=1 Tax=Clostridium thermobutyricum TaxID=29372 RepID=N9WE89_9CLOT|nr:hypothetical protein [Clostridium thermobutyricum]ENZ01361.1 hypothetical protein HMPREF1092_02070 [Clostridium thermobutyricum]